MNYKNILVTGGAGFVGSNICIKLKEHFPRVRVFAFDNLYRLGSELNIPRLEKFGVTFLRGDVRNRIDLHSIKTDLIIECSAEPSVLAGVNSTPLYVLDTNVSGAINCFELARTSNADIIFLSTSRVYPIDKLNNLNLKESETRFALEDKQPYVGASPSGINENFPIVGVRSLYGATKLSAELLLAEFIDTYGIKGIINRFGVIAGPWQFGKPDQGIIAYWLAAHIFNKPLTYIGFGGNGKQVRDIMHVNDLFELILLQMKNIRLFNGKIYNVGGGLDNSVSLKELTHICQKFIGKKVHVNAEIKTRKNDVKLYITDNSSITKDALWVPKLSLYQIIEDTYQWIHDNSKFLQPIFAS